MKDEVKMEPYAQEAFVLNASLCINFLNEKPDSLMGSEAEKKLLNSYGIEPTPRKIQVLKIVQGIAGEFTIAEVGKLIRQQSPLASRSSIVNTLTLFKRTGLIKEIIKTGDSNNKRGRPEVKFIYPNKNKPRFY